jgi:hypothetical protein
LSSLSIFSNKLLLVTLWLSSNVFDDFIWVWMNTL